VSDEGSSILTLEEPIRLRVALVDIERLHHHEEVVPGLLEELVEQIRRDGLLKHPIIIDEASFVILDGTHRVEALRSLGCRRAPACLVDYHEPRIKLMCWYRTVRRAPPLPELVRALSRRLGLRVEFSDELEPEEVGVPPIALGLTDGRSYARVLGDFEDKQGAWELVKKVEKVLRGSGLQIGFEVEEDAMRKLSSGDADVVLMTPRITKRDVVETALSGRVFPHKTTRHVIPARPLFLNIPLRLLRDDRPAHILEAELRKTLAPRRLRRLPPGHVIEGRRYEEEVIILE